MPEVADTIAGIRAQIVSARAACSARGIVSPRVALVPTMGALHAGHLALVERAGELADVVVVSIFVNPTQFAPTEDLDKYPRDLAADLASLAHGAADFVFAPTVAEMYPSQTATVRVIAGSVGALFEGSTRPGHFDGVLTVVSKLLHICGPEVVLFGQKDAQQAFIVERLVADLDFPVAVEVAPTVRESDGLALSSRNRFLTAGERKSALLLSAMLRAAESAAGSGVEAAVAAARALLSTEPSVALDYFAVVDPRTFEPVVNDYRGVARVIVAALVGSTRLIDNTAIRFV